MNNVDKIMDMLDWNNSKEIQERGRKMASKIGNIDIFLQPISDAYDKNVWGNCAKVLSQKTDAELAPYLVELLEWLQDMNWPGACCILERMKQYKITEVYNIAFRKCMDQALESEDEIWIENLLQIKEKNFELTDNDFAQ